MPCPENQLQTLIQQIQLQFPDAILASSKARSLKYSDTDKIQHVRLKCRTAEEVLQFKISDKKWHMLLTNEEYISGRNMHMFLD